MYRHLNSRTTAKLPFACTRRYFSISGRRPLKESDHSPDQASENEKHKQDQLDKASRGQQHWKPELASNSEEAVKADRHNSNDSIADLQKKTVDHVSKKSKTGTSQDDSH